MKKIFTLIFVFVAGLTTVFADDSTSVQLSRYREYYSQGLITETEYTKLKADLLFHNSYNEDTTSLPQIKSKYIGDFVAGSILAAGGVSAIGVGVWYKNGKAPAFHFGVSDYEARIKNWKRVYISTIAVGSVATVAGLILDILGIKEKQKYIRKSKAALSMSDGGLGLKFSF